MKILVIGAGIFGSSIATELSKDGHNVTLVEKEHELMLQASRCNHNRIHFGYHYPRSVLTTKQSIDGLLSFLISFKDAIITDFPNYYAIAKEGSLTSTRDFMRFCDEVGITYREEFPPDGFFDNSKLESCFRVSEPIFDYFKLRDIVASRLRATTTRTSFNTECLSIKRFEDRSFLCTFSSSVGSSWCDSFDFVINASYASLNRINTMLGVKQQDLLFEDVTIPVFKHDLLPRVGLTIMDGQYCTIMPRGFNVKEFLLYHVEKSVYARSRARDELKMIIDPIELEKKTNQIFESSLEYMPFLCDAKFVENYRTIRAVYENKSDARLSEIHAYKECENYISVLSGKISTAVKIALQVRAVVSGNLNAGAIII